VKTYRIPELDIRLRKERTKQEARLLHRAKIAGVSCPTVLFVDEFSIGMSRIKGKRPKMNAKEMKEAGKILAKLHNANIIHGDFTPANLLLHKGISVIDFGLGFFSSDIEDKAVDVLTIVKAIKNQKEFLQAYSAKAENAEKIIKRLEEVKKRARYS
ncbi:Kae1-associated serine/threonine protein kinase, partial [Candidatus Micrarchaeota archaeon]|nr:Kae1-associated serine/threonine protein kinase [Candidatus Micrarchaeota archaeon]